MMISSMEMVINLRTNASGEIIWGKQMVPGDDGGLGKNPGFESVGADDGGNYCASKTEDDLLKKLDGFVLLLYEEKEDIGTRFYNGKEEKADGQQPA